MSIDRALKKLEKYIVSQQFKGYDPYDTLLSWVPFKALGKWGPVLGIQFQKRNPVNIRPLLGIKKEINPKAYGLFLQAYSIRYQATGDPEDLARADYFFDWLSKNYSKGYSGKCWGYNFPWASPEKYMKPFIPSAVVTGFVVKGLYAYYHASPKAETIELIESACRFLDQDLEKVADETGLSISYTPIKKDVCYNASLLAAESMARLASLKPSEDYAQKAIRAVEYVLARQQETGMWKYSLNLETGVERHQIDFHQGYVLESIFEIKRLLNIERPDWDDALKRGLTFYIEKQFEPEGWSHWRLPRVYPVEIHNQSQGIITLLKLKAYHPRALPFAGTIAEWTIDHMQAARGSFYYQKFRRYTNKIPYMRWSQAWMFLALTQLKHLADD
jgi:hypothetical protein